MKLFPSLVFLLITFVAQSQSEKNVSSSITNVTVFLSKAQITREVNTHIDAGKTSLVLTGLTSDLDPQSIQVSGKGSLTILGISQRENYLTDINTPRALKILTDSVDILNRQLVLEKSQKEILTKEEQMLVSNQRIGGNNQNLTVAELKAMADFYRSRLTDIVTTNMKEDEKIIKINSRLVRLQQQIEAKNELYSRNTSEIVVNLSADAPTAAVLEVTYLVNSATWNAVYDVRAINTKSPLQLNYKANVHQSTGEDWTNVRLKLSTANPTQGGLKPELSPWYLNLVTLNEVTVSYNSDKRKASPMRGVEQDLQGKVAGLQVSESKSLSEVVIVAQTALNTVFDISIPYTVPSAVNPTLVDIKSYEMKADYHYAVAPKLDADAFLIATATGWEDYNLLPGHANIFFEGTFVGESVINPNITRDTLSLSLGRDKRISVKREKVKELTSKKLIGTNKKESFAWEITVRNNKPEPVKITVEDQVPVSQDSKIEVAVTDVGGANYVKDSGKLKWDLTLQPNEIKKLTVKYEVKYPKDEYLDGL